MFLSRPSDQSCMQCCRGEGNSDLYKGTEIPLVVFRVCINCVQRTVPEKFSGFDDEVDTRCLLKCAVAHS